jgi:hypothetical protein
MRSPCFCNERFAFRKNKNFTAKDAEKNLKTDVTQIALILKGLSDTDSVTLRRLPSS